MTAEEFVAMYKGRRVRVNENANNPGNIGRTAIVAGVVSAYPVNRILLDMDDGMRKGHKATADVLDLIDNSPLPLPG